MKHSRPHLRPLLLAFLALAATGCAVSRATREAQLATRLDEILNRLSDTGAIYTARVLELPGRNELYAHDCDTPFTPASNMKVLVSTTGLDMFGLEHTFKTYLAIDGNDLWIIGTGDPGLGDPRLAKRKDSTATGVLDEWASALASRGIKQVRGNLYYYDGALDAEWVHPTWRDSVLHWYGAPVAGLIFNNNCIDITVHPTAEGELVQYTVVPPVQNITVINECRTGEKHAPTIEKLPGSNTYKLGGTCAKQEELKSKPVEDPGAFLADALRTHLAARGVVVDGQSLRAAAPLEGAIPPPEKTIAVHETSLRDILGRIDTNSQNLFAEALCKLNGQAYAAQEGRPAPGSWADGERAMRAFLQSRGIDDGQLVVADGSGLSAANKVTARLLTDLFAVMLARPDGGAFVDSLAKGGVNGTLEQRFAGCEGHVFAKTGQISGVRALSGYVKTYKGQWIAFSIIYNQIPGEVEPYEALQDEAVRLLIKWPDIN